jgi:hypothetical protein
VLQLLLVFVFFLPLISVQIPSIIAGFSINPARLAITCCIGAAIAAKCLYPYGPSRESGAKPYNTALLLWVGFLVLSVLFYYILLPFGVGVRFGEMESFFRSWRGRPIAQLISLVTYGIAPYLLIRHYATEPRRRRAIEGALVAAILLLVAYGYFQQVSYHLGLPVTGRLLYEGAGVEQRLAAYSVGPIDMLRFYSLGGEPRDYGTFAIGAMLFYTAWGTGHRHRRTKLVVAALALSILLTLSTSAIIVLGLFAVVAVVDATRKGFVRVGTVARLTTALVVVAGLLVLTSAGSLLGARPLAYLEAVRTLGTHSRDYAFLLSAQSTDLGVAFYVLDLPDLPVPRFLFGFGFGNYGSGMSDILFRYFDIDVMRESTLEESRAFVIKMLVETGVVGVALLFGLFIRTLRSSDRLIAGAPDRPSRARQIALRYAYIAFFVAGMIQTSFYHFIVMGLIDAQRRRAPAPSPSEAS